MSRTDELNKQIDEFELMIPYLEKLLTYLEFNEDYIDGIKLLITEAKKDLAKMYREYEREKDKEDYTTPEQDQFAHYFDMGFHPERYE